MPTLVNNVETLANITAIIRNGAEWYRAIGTTSSPGTKVFTILGKVNSPGFIEVPMGITLREVIDTFGKGMQARLDLQAGPDRRLERLAHPTQPAGYPDGFRLLRKNGVVLGSGALLICDEDTCVIDLAKILLNFFRTESCGKCNPCRIGNHARLWHPE